MCMSCPRAPRRLEFRRKPYGYQVDCEDIFDSGRFHDEKVGNVAERNKDVSQ